MTRIITLISAKRGVGKSMLTANLAVLLAEKNQRVAILDANAAWPNLHHFFDLIVDESYAFNDYVNGKCKLVEVCSTVTDRLPSVLAGKLDLFRVGAAQSNPGAWVDARWAEKIYEMNKRHHYDFLLIDTQAGYARQEALLLASMSSEVCIILRADQQDYYGTRILVATLSHLGIPDVSLIANQILPIYDFDQVKLAYQSAFNVDVQVVLPMSEDVLGLGSSGLFVALHPNHDFTKRMQLWAAGRNFIA
jgi:septum site-determining protein MinD